MKPQAIAIETLRRQLGIMDSQFIRNMYQLTSRAQKDGEGCHDGMIVTLRLMREALASRVVGPKGKLP